MGPTVVTMDINGFEPSDYRAIVDTMGVEKNPSPEIYMHIAYRTENGCRIVEIWDSQKDFENFVENRLKPAIVKLGIHQDTKVTFQPLHNFFGPRISELPNLTKDLPGGPHSKEYQISQ